MISPFPCVLYSQDGATARRFGAYLRVYAQVRHVTDAERLAAVLEQNSPAVLLVDLRAKSARDFLDDLPQQWPEVLIIALGAPRSEPLREAEESGIYAAEDLQLERRHFQALILRALDHLRVLQENRQLRASLALWQVSARPQLAHPELEHSAIPLLRLPFLFQRFANTDALFACVVESLSAVTGVSRVGVFAKLRYDDSYALRAGLRCLPETAELTFREEDPLVCWLELHAHLICRANLVHATDNEQEALMRRALETFGAEVIVPLHMRGLIAGWLLFGHRNTGQPFDLTALENLTMLGEHVSMVLENALLQEEVAVQNSLADMLLKSIPPGIVATDENAVIRWFNPTAERLLGISIGDALNHPAEAVGSKIASMLRETLESAMQLPAEHWVDGKTRRSVSIETRRLLDGETSLGAVAVVHDLTLEDSLRQKQDLLDRATFWTDLAASMSHEIRNPLVAIKTFAQLLPERFDDADFRKDFNQIVVQEIDRLDRIITQINNFAHPQVLVMKPFDVGASVRKGLEMARDRCGTTGMPVEIDLPNDLPPIFGDELALTEAFAHLVANAAEATAGQTTGKISLAAKSLHEDQGADSVIVTVQDNGCGIDPEMKDKIFSPFCTTKPRGMGLGLPIVKRTIFDHNGRLDVESNPQGTSVSVMLPGNPHASN